MGAFFQIVIGFQMIWVLAAIGGSMVARKKYIPEGNIRAAKVALWCACIGDLMVCVGSAVGIIYGQGLMAMLMLALWGWCTYRDITLLSYIS